MTISRQSAILGFIGAGNMGGAVARNLATKGWTVQVFDPSSAAVAACADAGATGVDSAGDAVAGATHIITSLPTPEILTAEIEKILHSTSSAVIIDVSTIDPTTARALEDKAQSSGRHFIACPLGKGPAQAETGDIPLFVGGDAQVLDELEPLFDDMGSATHRMGGVEAATTFKVLSNLIGMTNLAVLAEGLTLARKAGIADEVFDHALKDTGALSYQQQVRLPWILANDWSPRFGVDLAVKDMRLAVDSAWRWHISVPVGTAALNQLAAASARGMGSEDVVAVAKIVDPTAATK